MLFLHRENNRSMKTIFRLVLFIVCAVPMTMWAQDDPTLKASAPKQVMVGERFQVVFEANAEGKNFQAPSFGNLTLLGGPFTSTSSSFSRRVISRSSLPTNGARVCISMMPIQVIRLSWSRKCWPHASNRATKPAAITSTITRTIWKSRTTSPFARNTM